MDTPSVSRALAELELRNRGASGITINPFAHYRFNPLGYIQDKLGWHPWAGDGEHPGQVEIIAAYELALRQLHERDDYEQGNITASELRHWQPGQVIQNRIRTEAGHTVGKTKMASGILSHFFDTCDPAIIYSFAPGYDQINDLLWKEIRTDRRKANLPGRILETPELKYRSDHFAKGRATNDDHGKGTERVQGQHGKYLMFVIDEAEGVADFVYSAIESMASGGIAIVLMLANPRTRTSRFYKQRTRQDTVNFRISCIYHPNVLADREIVPGAVRRQYVENMLEHCEEVSGHNDDDHTFEIPWRPGTIYKPDAEFMFRVLGVAPKNLSTNTFFTTGRFEQACKRSVTEFRGGDVLRIGVDVARYGTDSGTIYIRWRDKIWRHCAIQGQDTNRYRDEMRKICIRLKGEGAKSLHLRVDGGGGYASGIIDPLRIDMDFLALFSQVAIMEVHNNGEPHDKVSYADLGTEIYAEAAETIKGCAIINPPPLLESDLTERPYTYVNKSGHTVKKLVDKEQFKRKEGRSPDDGDGFCLAAAPDHIFRYIDPAGLVDFA
jgi:hypothetical protein